MIYEDLPPLAKKEAEAALRSDSTDAATSAMIRVGLHENDSAWAEDLCLRALADARDEVVAAAITSAGHLARRHRASGPMIVNRLRILSGERKFAGRAEDTLEDILQYLADPTEQ